MSSFPAVTSRPPQVRRKPNPKMGFTIGHGKTFLNTKGTKEITKGKRIQPCESLPFVAFVSFVVNSFSLHHTSIVAKAPQRTPKWKSLQPCECSSIVPLVSFVVNSFSLHHTSLIANATQRTSKGKNIQLCGSSFVAFVPFVFNLFSLASGVSR